ncbi:FAD-dependent oxidoreductase [Thermoanaerobacterium butyriciformans]|uniref:FAD-dependent oxidoreductase n=1 Tax=Thermoanaerobacterium butyriciformans TaxID=1702242 RepID=UPI0032C45841
MRGVAENVNLKSKEVTLKDGNVIKYDKLIIAIGVIPFIPNIPGINLKNVTTFKTEDELLRIKDATKNLQKAVVIGAGAIGIELAQALNAVGIKTYLIDMMDHILPQLVDNDMIEEGQRLIIENERFTICELVGQGLFIGKAMGKESQKNKRRMGENSDNC